MRKNRIVQLIGIGLILASLVLIGFLVVQGRVARQENEKVVFQIAQLLPPRTPGIMDQYTVMEMPVLQVKGQDYIALLEAPGYGIKLPVRSSWSAAESRKCPCRFYGTVYDGSLVVGGQAEQLAFLTQIGHDESVVVTDMTGAQFRYVVYQITRSADVSVQKLMDPEADLTLFAWSDRGGETVIVRCKMKANV